ncbi:fungal-specific transcription factor domain-domain-containing protein [Naematelia encephala]|uniref:Fungal-specific transcription factor domain-domain-containing protein n=1 Tax=Naematelia encephala TaxID=71784 RepID=A0A1Y2BBS8_9TREE|nr:fungal-specific transcription factor domain-domain-containing protein [Naematelia encephala]
MSSYPLPSISTLSQVLAAATPIDPGLLAEDGMPPPLSSNHTHRSTSGYSSFERSAARDDDSRWDGYNEQPSTSSRNIQPWDQDYHDDHVTSRSASPPRKKRPRQSKGRQGNTVSELEGFDPSQELEYSHPSQDPKLGPIFVHPQPNAAQACVRCHRIKRKCDNARPRCAGCEKSDVACVFELSAATSGFVHQLKAESSGLHAQISAAHQRIAELESLLSQNAGHTSSDPWQPRDSFPIISESRTSPLRIAETFTTADFATLAQSVLTPHTEQVQLNQTIHQPLPEYASAKASVDTFFDRCSLSYPLLGKAELLHDLDELYLRKSQEIDPSKLAPLSEVTAGKDVIVLMVIAIGTIIGERVSSLVKGSSRTYKTLAMSGFSSVVNRKDILSVQALILLGIYSLYDPSDISLWHVVGLGSRIAVEVGLHRHQDSPSKEAEQRKRVFWSLYSLDRLISNALGRPFALPDADIDVERPSPLPEDGRIDSVPTTVVTDHIINLRQLSGRIYTALYSVSSQHNSSDQTDRDGILSDLLFKLDANSTISIDGGKKANTINHNTWLTLASHQIRCDLYRPSALYPTPSDDGLSELYQSSSRCVELYLDIWRNNRLAYNAINVYAQLVATFALVYSLAEFDGRQIDGEWREEVVRRLSHCQEILKIFGKVLPGSVKYSEVFERICATLASKYRTNGDVKSTNATTGSRWSSRRQNGASTDTYTSSSKITTAAQVTTEGVEAIIPGTSRAEAWEAMMDLWRSGMDLSMDLTALEALSDQAEIAGRAKASGELELIERLF